MHSCQIPEWMTEPRKGREWNTYFLKILCLLKPLCKSRGPPCCEEAQSAHTVRPYGEGEGLRLHRKRLAARVQVLQASPLQLQLSEYHEKPQARTTQLNSLSWPRKTLKSNVLLFSATIIPYRNKKSKH